MSASGSELRDIRVSLGERCIAALSGTVDLPELQYANDWVRDGFPLAPCLPFGMNHRGAKVRAFFENMLPEGAAFEHLLSYAGTSRSNVFGLALALRNDLPGTISLALSESSDVSSELSENFREITDEEITKRLARLDEIPIDSAAFHLKRRRFQGFIRINDSEKLMRLKKGTGFSPFPKRKSIRKA